MKIKKDLAAIFVVVSMIALPYCEQSMAATKHSKIEHLKEMSTGGLYCTLIDAYIRVVPKCSVDGIRIASRATFEALPLASSPMKLLNFKLLKENRKEYGREVLTSIIGGIMSVPIDFVCETVFFNNPLFKAHFATNDDRESYQLVKESFRSTNEYVDDLRQARSEMSGEDDHLEENEYYKNKVDQNRTALRDNFKCVDMFETIDLTLEEIKTRRNQENL